MQDDLIGAGCDSFALAQHVTSSLSHLPVQRYLTSDEFASLEQAVGGIGLSQVVAGPLVRSSDMDAPTLIRSSSPGSGPRRRVHLGLTYVGSPATIRLSTPVIAKATIVQAAETIRPEESGEYA